jgi:two-component system response regulator YesN
MHRILVVDNEVHVVDYLVNMFTTTEAIELDIYKAYSAKAALKILSETDIDIIMTDYQMPGMSGLDLLQNVNANWVGKRVIFLSGYSEFDYIYQAAAKGAIRYILKTEDDDVIIQAVVDAATGIERERDQLLASELAQGTDDFFKYVDLCDAMNRALNDRECMADCCFDLRYPVLPAICIVNQFENTRPRSEILKLRFSLNLLANKLFYPHARVVLLETERGLLYWLLQARGQVNLHLHNPALPPIPFLSQIFENLQKASMGNLDLHIGIYLHDEPVTWKDLKMTVELLALKAEKLEGIHVYSDDPIVFSPSHAQDEEATYQELVRRIRCFVVSNLEKDLSLTNISCNVYYNPYYISRIHKLVTGENLSSFICSQRIKKARALLSSTDNSIAVIARCCGFDSSQYFATVFKRTEKMTPQEYRELSRTKQQEL